MMSLLVNGTGPLILLITHAIDEHKSRLSYMTLLKNMRQPRLEPGAQAWEACMLPLHLVALLHRSGLRRTRRDCVISPCCATPWR